MYGLDAISATNGWSMAIAGALIVMSGLSVLSCVISQLHKIAALLEKGLDKKKGKAPIPVTELPPASNTKTPSFNLEDARNSLAPLAEELGEEFDLKVLYEIATANDLPHIHLSIRSLRESGVIVPSAEGRYRWQG